MILNDIKIDDERIAEICKRFKINELALFGSALREDYSENSDVDLLVEFIPNSAITLFNIVELKEELEKIFGREVDIVSKNAVINSRNYL
ncbi:MAG: nucleotidyltransferase domain-containing protein, partial [Ignavibacteria bacterium]|nr:nucleotidyltransferase domain-containing protein [Ignavibacteria bacterium]